MICGACKIIFHSEKYSGKIFMEGAGKNTEKDQDSIKNIPHVDGKRTRI